MVEAILICSEDTTVPFTVRFRYDRSDPYAVRVCFPVIDFRRSPTTWVFARSLLEEGQRVESGEGDVRVLPCGPDHLGLEIRDRAGNALILLSAKNVRGFIAETYQMVPAGSEHDLLNLDDGLSKLLGRTH